MAAPDENLIRPAGLALFEPATGSFSVLLIWIVLIATFIPDLYDVTRAGRQGIFSLFATAVIGLGVVVFISGGIPITRLFDGLSRSWLLIAYACWLMLSQFFQVILYGNLSQHAFWAGIGYAMVALAGCLVYPLRFNSALVRHFCLALAVLGIISSIAGMMYCFFGKKSFAGLTLHGSQYMSVLGIHTTSSFFRQRTAFGAQAFLGAVGCLFFLMQGRMKKTAAAGLLLCLTGIFISWARGVWLAAFVGACAWLMTGVDSIKKTIVMILCGVTIMGLAVFSSHSVFLSKILIMERGLSQREELWPSSIAAIYEKPVLGHGIGQAGYVRLRMMGIMESRHMLAAGRVSGFHNFLIDTVITAGIPSLCFLLGFMGLALFRLMRSNMPVFLKKIIVTGLTGMLIISFFTTYNIGGVRMPSFVLAVFFGIANLSDYFTCESYDSYEVKDPA